MDLESELKKLLNERIASNERAEPVVRGDSPIESLYGEWTPAPWHREEWRQRDSRQLFSTAA